MISSFSFPAPIRYGVGALEELPDWLRKMEVKNPLVVTDPGLLLTRAFALLREQLPQAALFSGVHSNPMESDVNGAVMAFKEGGCDGVIGFGGGSALDVAKIARLAGAMLPRPWPEVTWQDAVPALAPFVAIPTTAGTGSEVGRSSVLTFGRTKRVVFHPSLLASLVILDPRLTVDLPAKLTAATGVDALTHCIESLTSPVFHPLCDAIAIEGLRIVFAFLPRAVGYGGDLEARGMMQIAATMGGIAFQKDLGAAHSLSHPLSVHFGLNHGLANALCLLPVMRFNAGRKPGIYRRLAVTLELEDKTDQAVLEATESLLQRIGIIGGLRNHGVEESALEMLADAAFADGCHATNPVPVTREDLLALYVQAL